MLFILFWVQVVAASSLSALGGAGYALSFSSLSGTDVAALSETMDCTQSFWPRKEFALSFWMRCTQSNDSFSCGVPISLQRWSGTQYNGTYMLFGPEPLALSTSKNKRQLIFVSLFERVNGFLPTDFDIFKWHHWHVQWGGEFYEYGIYLDGVAINKNLFMMIQRDDFCNSRVTPTLVLGSLFGNPISAGVQLATDGFQGQIDEVCVWNRSLSDAEVLNLASSKLSGTEPGLVLYYDMDQPSDTVVKNLAFTGSKYDLLLGRTKYTGGYFDPKRQAVAEFTKPRFGPSEIPIQSTSPLLCFPVSREKFSSLQIFSSLGAPTMTSTPLYGDLWNTLDGVNPIGSPLQIGDNLTHPEGFVIFWANGNFSQDNFTYEVGGVSGLVSLLYSAPAVQESIALKVTPPVNVTVAPKFNDPLGLGGVTKIILFPAVGQLWNFNSSGLADPSSPINETHPNVMHPSGLFQYYSESLVGENVTYVHINEADVESDPQNLSTTINNVLPIAVKQNYSVGQNDRKLMELNVTDVNGDVVSIIILDFPKHGSLYYAQADGTMGELITGALNPNDNNNRVSSYATKVTGYSSTRATAGSYYHPNQTLGEQDVFAYGVSPQANLFLATNGVTPAKANISIYDPSTWFVKYGYTEYLEWEFADPTYVYSILIGMCSGPGSIVRVKAWSPVGWKPLWTGKPDMGVALSRAYWKFQPPICQTNYKTNRLRVEYDTRTVEEASTDFISLVGLKKTLYGALEFGTTKLYYVPERNYVGPDSFKIRAFDCAYFDASSNDALVSINVYGRPQPPIISSDNVTIALDSTAPIHLNATELSGKPVFFTIYSLPSLGKLKDGNAVIESVPHNVSGSIRYVPDLAAWNRQANVSFEYSATGFMEALPYATITIALQEPTPDSPVLAWLVIFAISALCTPSYLLVIYRRHKYPIRTRSLTVNLLFTTATLLSINIPIFIITFGRDYSCSFYYWSFMLFPAFATLAIVLALVRQRALFHLEKLKTLLSSRGMRRKTGLDGTKLVALEDVRYLKAATSEAFALKMAVLGVVIIVIIAASCTNVAAKTVGQVYCQMAPVISSWLLVVWTVGALAIAVGLYSITSYVEGTGFRQSIFYFLVAEISLGVIYIILLSVDTAKFESASLLLCVILLIYQGFGILSPCLSTFDCLRSVVLDGILPFPDIIATRNGFAWFLDFCKSEFSLENPLCWKEIQNFKVKTSYAAMRNIYERFFAENAPLAVNLSSSSMHKTQQICNSMTEQTSLYELQTIFDIVQLELMQLMLEDSFRRFLDSDHYRGFKKGDPPPKQLDISTSSTSRGEEKQPTDSFLGASRSRMSPITSEIQNSPSMGDINEELEMTVS